jgi:hypothetical protein
MRRKSKVKHSGGTAEHCYAKSVFSPAGVVTHGLCGARPSRAWAKRSLEKSGKALAKGVG